MSEADGSDRTRVHPGRSVIAQVRRLEFNGPELLATLALGPHRLVARLPASQPIEDRQRVEVRPGPEPGGLVRPVDGRSPAELVSGTRTAKRKRPDSQL